MTDEIRIPPQSLESEKSVLGCQLLGGNAVDVVREIIGPQDFYSDHHQIVQKAILVVHEANNGNVDVLLVVDHLNAKGLLEKIGGPSFIQDLMESVPYAQHAAEYAHAVLNMSRRRKAIAIGKMLVEKSYDMGCDLSEIAEAANDAAMKICESLNSAKSRPRALSEHVREHFESRIAGKNPTVFWGIDDIDRAIGGVAPGELIIIGGRPSHGKTMLAMQWLDTASLRGIPGLIVSEEMSADSLAGRALSSITAIEQEKWMDDQRRIMFDIKEHFANRAPLLVAEKCSTISRVERAIDRAVQSHGIRIVGVDYAQLVEGVGDSVEQRISNVSYRMKAMAMKHDLVVLLLAQLNRGIEGRENQAPKLSDLRGSGGLEQDADVALFPFWPLKADQNCKDAQEYRIYVRKNRNRGIGTAVIEMRINPSRQRLEPYQPEDPTAGYGDWR